MGKFTVGSTVVEDASNGNSFPEQYGEVQKDLIVRTLGAERPALLMEADKAFLEQGNGVMVIAAPAIITAEHNGGVEFAWVSEEAWLGAIDIPIDYSVRQELVARSIIDDHAAVIVFDEVTPPMVVTLHRARPKTKMVTSEVDVRVQEAADNIDDVIGRADRGETQEAMEFIDRVDMGDMSAEALKKKRDCQCQDCKAPIATPGLCQKCMDLN